MAISDEQIEEIRAKTDIADLVSSYGLQLKHSGRDLWCCCPFHTEKTPSFKVDSVRGTFHCFGCGESGDIFSFIQKQDGLSFGEAVRKLAERAGIELKAIVSPFAKQRHRLYELMAALASDFNKMLKSPKNTEGEVAREYLRSRQLDNSIVNKFLIGYAPKDVDKILAWASRHGYSYQDLAAAGIIKVPESADKKPFFYFANRLVFSIKDKDGRVVAFSGRQLVEDKKSGKYVNSPETIIFKKSRTFYAFDEARKYIVKAPNREALVCEGQIDCIRLHSNGFNTAVAPLGTAFTEDHAVMLHRVADTALLCFDDDGAGHKATIRAAQILLSEGMPVRVLSLPDGDDPDSYLIKHGKEAFSNLINTSVESIVAFQIRAERAKEKNPDDSNAIVRVTRAVLETISKCKDKVLRTILLKEAAKRLEVDFKTLDGAISKSIKEQELQANEDAEQIIDDSKNTEQTKQEMSTLPSLAEDALLNYLLSHEGDNEVRACLKRLIPTKIISSPMAAHIIEAWMADAKDGIDMIQRVVESLSIEEYRHFLANIITIDGAMFSDIPSKNIILYFARQIWHEFLTRRLKENLCKKDYAIELIAAIKKLHKETMRGVVHLIQHFPLEKYA